MKILMTKVEKYVWAVRNTVDPTFTMRKYKQERRKKERRKQREQQATLRAKRKAACRSVNPDDFKGMSYDEYLATDFWDGLRSRMLGRARYRCEECGGKKKLHVHHKVYRGYGLERLSDLVVLCRQCHAAKHGLGKAPEPKPTGEGVALDAEFASIVRGE